MTLKHSLLVGLLSLCTSLTVMAATDINGVKVEDNITLAGSKLQLNGAGIRYKAIFKVYVGELHTTQKVSSLDELIAAPGPKRLSMTFLRESRQALSVSCSHVAWKITCPRTKCPSSYPA